MKGRRCIVPMFDTGQGTGTTLLFAVFLILVTSLTVLLSLSGISSGGSLPSGPRGTRAAAHLGPEAALNPGLVAGTFVAFGPADYIRSTKKPISVTDSFSILNPNTSYTLHVYNGGKYSQAQDKVSAAVIRLNGAEVVGRSEISWKASHIEKPINLSYDNELVVEIGGKPGSRLMVEIIGVDNDLPTIVATLTPPPNGAGWNNTDVTVIFQCSDMTSGIASCSDPVPVTTEGGGQIVTGHATDMAGNTASTSVTVNLDKTPPAITAAQMPLPNPAGWNNTEVAVSFQCSDMTSGIASCSDPVLVKTEGGGQIVTGHATDIAGNTASTSVTVNLDKSPPSVAITNPADGIVLDSSSVNVMGNVSDAISGIATVTCNGTPVPFVSSTFSSDVPLVRGDNPITVEATDVAGNTGHASITVIGDLQELELAYIDKFELEAHFIPYLGIYKPIVPSGFHAIGHYGEFRSPTHNHPHGFTFAVKGLTPTALAWPVGWERVYYSSRDDKSLWRPVPPEGYVCLGFVSTGGISEPDTTEVVCIRRDLVVPGKVGNTIDLCWDWDSLRWGCGAWQIIPADANGIFSGTGIAGTCTNPNICTPPTDSVFCLDARSVKTYELDSGDIHSLVQTQGPQLRLHSYEEYFLDDPEYILDWATLHWDSVYCPANYDLFKLYLYDNVKTSAATLIQDFEDHVETDPHYQPMVFGQSGFKYYLRFPNDLLVGNLARARVLVRVRPWNQVFTDVQFWFFYPFNGPGKLKDRSWGVYYFLDESGRHEGDWEQVTLRYFNDGKELVVVFLSQHDKIQMIPRPEFDGHLEFVDEHPVIYSAQSSHANYVEVNMYFYKHIGNFGPFGDLWLFDRTSNEGEWFNVYDEDNYWIASSEMPGYLVQGPDWLRFDSRWGRYYPNRDVVLVYPFEEVKGGPTGPAMKPVWDCVSSEHWWWVRNLYGQEACVDGVDNDGDGKIDCDDPDCLDHDPVCLYGLDHAYLAGSAPAPPSGLTMTSAAGLAWNECADEDFDYFTVYGSAAPGLGSSAVLIGHTTGTAMDVTNDQYSYYHVTATNAAGNEGGASSVENTYAGVVADKDLPLVFALKPNRPNPFASRTMIAFDLPEPYVVRLKVVDVQGRVVRVLTDKAWPAGRHSTVWRGENDTGQLTGSGIYFVRIEAGGFTATNKVLLMK